MKSRPSLDDLSLFLQVAETGSLSAASKLSGTSVPTLGRKMTRLEEQTGRRLFQRGAAGYALTPEGCNLRAEAMALREAEKRIELWQAHGPRARRVRITGGDWTLSFIARNLRQVWSEDAIWVPEFIASTAMVDIARRAADIGIRNRRPAQEWLAGRRTRHISFAEYGRDETVKGYINLPQEISTTPTTRWLWENRADQIVMQVSDARLRLDLACAGIGRVLLPTFIGDAQPGLKRLAPAIKAIGNDEWLVCHHEARHEPPIRAALEALATLLTDVSLRSTPP